MNSTDFNTFPKEKAHFLLPGPAGQLEVVTTYPKEKCHGVGIICHPHPLYEGTMNNKVVTTLARAFEKLDLATVRFNFRGIGQSEGSYGETVGETEDLLAVLDWVKNVLPQYKIWLAGFSFGSYISANVANQLLVAQLVSIAPPVHHFDFEKLDNIRCPWLVVQGDQDEVVPFAMVEAWAKRPPSPLELVVLPNVSHFFHGKLIELRELLIERLAKNIE